MKGWRYMKKNKIKISMQEKQDVIKQLLFIVVAVMAIGAIYRLKLPFILIIIIFTLAIIPEFYREKVKEIRHRHGYDNVITYLEQVLYSFKKYPKIREALVDAQKVSDAQLKEIIEEAVLNIDSKITDDIYKESLKIIEDEFPCRRVKSTHEFIIKIEKQGGEYKDYINMLLSDIKAWNDRTRIFMNEIKRIKRNVLISIISTLITCGFMIILIPKGYSYTDKLVYQITTVIMFILMIGVYYLILKKLNIDWISEKEGLSPQSIDRYYEILNKGVSPKSNVVEKSNYKSAKKRLEKEITKEFPDWLRETAINLQIETVQSAIEHSYDRAPYVMKEPIRKILLDFEDYPVGIEPYDNFLKKLYLPEVKSSMKMLYSMCELGKEESGIQIGSIIDRNMKLENQAETLKNKDRIGVASFLVIIPMFVGVLKIMSDMVLMILVFTGALSNVLHGGFVM